MGNHHNETALHIRYSKCAYHTDTIHFELEIAHSVLKHNLKLEYQTKLAR
jgi:hypothetical protein